MKVYLRTKQTPLHEVVNFVEYPWSFKDGTKIYQRCQEFVMKEEGKYFVDGQFTSNWVRYIRKEHSTLSITPPDWNTLQELKRKQRKERGYIV